MVHYQGQITGDGELVVELDGRMVPLREFLRTTKLSAKRQAAPAGDGRRLRNGTWAVAK